MSKTKSSQQQSVIIKKYEISASAHHGGAWKIAYADFVTAMMAFFLVMWLINATTEEQRKGIASYFNPMALQKDALPPFENVLSDEVHPLATTTLSSTDLSENKKKYLSKTRNSLVQIKNKKTELSLEKINDKPSLLVPSSCHENAGQDTARCSHDTVREKLSAQIRQAILANKDLNDIASQVTVTAGDDGIHVQITDTDNKPMFSLGSTKPTTQTQRLLETIVPFLVKLPGSLSIVGYTDAAPFRPGALSNWGLSSGRAVSVRDILVQSGFPDWRLLSVSGRADHDLVDPAHPLSAHNRRVVFTLSKKI